MYNNFFTISWCRFYSRPTIRFIVVLQIFFFLSAQASANTYTQKIFFYKQNVPLGEVFKEVRKQTDYEVFFDANLLNQMEPVDVVLEDVSVQEALHILTKDNGLSYTITDKNVLISNRSVELDMLNAQEDFTLEGKVVDAKGENITGVSVKVKGLDKSATTNAAGLFKIRAPKGAFLIFTYIGFQSQEVEIVNEDPLNIVLLEDLSKLDEVVVVGYGTQKKTNVTGSIETIQGESIERKPVTSLTQALTGEASGVTVMQRSSRPGAHDEFIRIRGVGTWGNSNPLVLVDGIEASMSQVNPNDVESITVLKDAAAAAIYGSRAGNGVILITTKQGAIDGKVNLTYSGNLGVQVPTRLPNYNTTYDYYALRNLELQGRGSQPIRNEEQMENYKNGVFNPDLNEANTNWIDEVMRNAVQQNHNMTIKGGGQKTSYFLSLGYLDQHSVVGDQNWFKKINGRINTSTDVRDWFKLDANLAYVDRITREPMGTFNGGVTDVIQNAYKAPPYVPVRYSDGTWAFPPGGGQNAVRLATTDDFGHSLDDQSNIMGYISPEFRIIEGLRFKSVLSANRSISKYNGFTKIFTYDEFVPEGSSSASQNAGGGVARNNKQENWSENFNYTMNATLDYEKQMGMHYINGVIGASRESFDYSFTNAQQYDLPEGLDAIGAGTASPIISGNRITSGIASYFGRLNYAFDERYLFEVNLRRDGSTIFAKGKQWGTFPAYSFAWNVSNEEFFKPINPVINSLKLRLSYGELGNNRIDDFKFLSIISANNDVGYSFGNDIASQAFYEQSMGNQSITWEKLNSKNLGLDFAILNNRLNISVDVYDRITNDILLDLPAPGTLGIAPPTINAGSVSNKGWDINGSWKNTIGKVNYSLGFNLSDVKNKILDLKDYSPSTSDLTIRKVGEPIDAIYGWVSAGVMLTEEQLSKYEDQMIDLYGGDKNGADIVSRRFGLGDVAYEDLNGDGKIDSKDKRVIGNQIPRYTYGFNFSAEYGPIAVSLSFQGVGKADGYLTNEAKDALLKPGNVYSESNQNPDFPRMGGYEDGYNSFWVEDASYLRLKNAQVNYTLDKLKGYGIQNVQLFFTGSNLFTLTKFRGWDPESPVGMRGWTYPITSVYSFGVNLSF